MTEEVVTPAPREYNGTEIPPPAPVLGDVLDALDDAAASFKVVAQNEVQDLLGAVRSEIRARPIKMVALAAGAAYLLGRLAR